LVLSKRTRVGLLGLQDTKYGDFSTDAQDDCVGSLLAFGFWLLAFANQLTN